MKRSPGKYLFFTAYFLFLGLGALVIWTFQKQDSGTRRSYKSPRSFDLALKEEYTFRYPGTTIQTWQEYENRLVILDQAAQQWYVLSHSGRIEDTLGTSGPAPWQNQLVKGFRMMEKGIYSVDARAMAVRFTPVSTANRTYRKLQRAIWDGIHLDNNEFLLLNDESRDFGVFTFNMGTGVNGLVQRFSDFTGNVSENMNVALEGMLIPGGNQHFYVCSRAGLFFTISRTGQVDSMHSTIDKTPIPKIAEKQAGNIVIFERLPDEIINYAATADDSSLYVLSQIAYVPSTRIRLDRYKADGTYAGSAEVPNHKGNLPVNILKGQEYLYVLYEDQQLITYSLQPLNEN